MLSSSSPFVERGRGNRWAVVVTAHMFGGVVGGGTMGALCGLLGSLVARSLSHTAQLGLLAAGAAVGLAFDLRLGRLRLPSSHRQVPEAWRYEYRGWVYGLAYGFLLGIGFATIIPVSATYVVFGAAVLSGSVGQGAVLGAAFGLARSTALLTTRRVQSADDQRSFFERLHARLARVDIATRSAQGVLLALTVLMVMT